MKLPWRKSNRGESGMSLVEVMVATALGGMVLAVVAMMWAFGSRSFAALANYSDLDSKSRFAVDQMSRDIRQATGVISFQNTGNTRWLTLTNADSATTFKYTWDATDRTLSCQAAGRDPVLLLPQCDDWSFLLYQRTPQKSRTNTFWLAKGVNGQYDLSICKLIDMQWTCSRTLIGQRVNTESVQTAQIVLRNKQ